MATYTNIYCDARVKKESDDLIDMKNRINILERRLCSAYEELENCYYALEKNGYLDFQMRGKKTLRAVLKKEGE